MVKKFAWMVVSIMMVLSLVMASCGTTAEEEEEEEVIIGEEEEEEEEEVAEEEVDVGAPQYGGVFTMRQTSDPGSFEPYAGSGHWGQLLWGECLVRPDWSVDQSVWDFKTGYIPLDYWTGALAESWELPDMSTYIFHIREGVHWQDVAPLNGREFTAYDAEYTYHRMLGLGSGYTEMCPMASPAMYANIESVTATDKYTLVFKSKTPSLQQWAMIKESHGQTTQVPREVVDEYGDGFGWKQVIGTGPFILKDYVSGASLTCVRNPNYWRYDDDPYSQNQLPYLDQVRMLIIPDTSTAIAALRTGKVHVVRSIDWEMAKNLKKTDPHLKQIVIPAVQSDSINMRVDKEPFTDIRVRRAMQMAIDLDTIAASYYGGTIDGTPYGLIPPAYTGYYVPFDEWPQEVKDGYTYNPEGAMELLDEAGYPDGFQTTLTLASNDDLNIFQVLKAYLSDINVDVTIDMKDAVVKRNFTRAGTHEMTSGYGTITWPPLNCLNARYSTHPTSSNHGIVDATFDDYVVRANATLDADEQRNLIREADMYGITQQWVVNVLPKRSYNICYPELEGFGGQDRIDYGLLWLNQD
ncbi:ABC transporter substrate-binding protein [Chloroflexota bacterium]